MPTTPTYALPYPAPTDPADVPHDMQALATRLDAVLVTPPAAPVWTAIPNGGFANANFQNYAGVPCAYMKDNAGVVHMRGLAQWLQGVSPANQPIWVAPAGYRPSAAAVTYTLTSWIGLDSGPHGACRVDVTQAGVVSLNSFFMQNDPGGAGYSGCWVSLGGLHWSTL